MKMDYDFTWLDSLDDDMKQGFAKVVAIFMKDLTPEDLAKIDADDECSNVE